MMRDGLTLYLRYLGISLRAQMQYRASFLMLSLGQFLITGAEFVGVWVLFDRFGSVQGWTLPQVALFYGLANMSFAVADAASRGFDMLPAMVKGGDFDRLLLRPRSTALQLAGQELTLRRIGRFLQGLLVLLWAMSALDVAWAPAHLALMAGAVAGGTCLFSGLFVLQATLAFWTTESLEIANTVTYGGVEAAQFPLTIYCPWFRRFFTVVVPLACVAYFPAATILDRAPLFGWVTPLVGIAFLALALWIWEIGVRHYRSTGS